MPERAALVTGASSGIGPAMARMLGEEGQGLTVAARRPEKLADAAASLRAAGVEVEEVAANMADEADVQRVVAGHAERWGRLELGRRARGDPRGVRVAARSRDRGGLRHRAGRGVRAHTGRDRVTPTILIVDDDPLIRKLITTTLQDVAGFGLREAGDGEEALEAAVEEAPEIVFLDSDMPRLNGIETCRRLRSDPVTADATIVMLTAMSDQPAQERAVDAGADLFLTKPFSPLRLLRLVDDLGAGRR